MALDLQVKNRFKRVEWQYWMLVDPSPWRPHRVTTLWYHLASVSEMIEINEVKCFACGQWNKEAACFQCFMVWEANGRLNMSHGAGGWFIWSINHEKNISRVTGAGRNSCVNPISLNRSRLKMSFWPIYFLFSICTLPSYCLRFSFSFKILLE